LLTKKRYEPQPADKSPRIKDRSAFAVYTKNPTALRNACQYEQDKRKKKNERRGDYCPLSASVANPPGWLLFSLFFLFFAFVNGRTLRAMGTPYDVAFGSYRLCSVPIMRVR
jgi:hypothetical protein